MHRRQTPKVRDGRVQKKNNWADTPAPEEIRLERRDPAWGGRHLITIAQLRDFIALLPMWDEVAVGLHAIVLDSADDCMGWCAAGIVAVCDWDADLWWEDPVPEWMEEHRELLDRLEVEIAGMEVRWTESQARAFQLLHILPHELGHHHDRITTRTKRYMGRGEPYAEAYALRVMDEVWPAYLQRFGL
jgi:hypothetical protein